ncbi:hypothetical protein [Neolewinella agarilytica]|uniref:Uncharacterized protein n=1 Tax=Neolewinella agarilytica TaxID=478744 RepID=A0A1H9J0C4_9BACT|nr:hypothetical protein [Neolewinella agarilytica]SEQ80293.1 hypothetical protein SAMN05444359_11635 [Neolewinella agarilytica]
MKNKFLIAVIFIFCCFGAGLSMTASSSFKVDCVPQNKKDCCETKDGTTTCLKNHKIKGAGGGGPSQY